MSIPIPIIAIIYKIPKDTHPVNIALRVLASCDDSFIHLITDDSKLMLQLFRECIQYSNIDFELYAACRHAARHPIYQNRVVPIIMSKRPPPPSSAAIPPKPIQEDMHPLVKAFPDVLGTSPSEIANHYAKSKESYQAFLNTYYPGIEHKHTITKLTTNEQSIQYIQQLKVNVSQDSNTPKQLFSVYMDSLLKRYANELAGKKHFITAKYNKWLVYKLNTLSTVYMPKHTRTKFKHQYKVYNIESYPTVSILKELWYTQRYTETFSQEESETQLNNIHNPLNLPHFLCSTHAINNFINHFLHPLFTTVSSSIHNHASISTQSCSSSLPYNPDIHSDNVIIELKVYASQHPFHAIRRYAHVQLLIYKRLYKMFILHQSDHQTLSLYPLHNTVVRHTQVPK